MKLEGVAVLIMGLLVAVVVTLVVVTTSNGASTRTGRINVTATLTHASSREAGPAGRQSNASEQAWRITDQYGHRIGRMLLQCRWIVARARFCAGEIAMPLGKITVAGASPTAFEGEFAVTGGTGVYRGGGGVMLFTAIGLRKQVLLVTITN